MTWPDVWHRSTEIFIAPEPHAAPSTPTPEVVQVVQLTGKKHGRRGTNPNSLANLKRSREKLRTVPRSTNSAENMARLRAAKAAKRNVTVVQTVEIASVANGGIIARVGQANVGSGNNGVAFSARPGEARSDQGRAHCAPASPPVDVWHDVSLVRRSAPHWEHLVLPPNNAHYMRRIGSVPVVRCHLDGEDRYWALTVDKLLTEAELDPIVTGALPATSEQDIAAARKLERRQWRAGGHSTAGSWLPTPAVTQRIVASLARPGENVTGLTALTSELAPKRLEILKEALPRLKRAAALWCPESEISHVELRYSRAAAERLQLQLEPVAYRANVSWSAIAESLRLSHPDALAILDCPGIPIGEVVDLAFKQRLPTIIPYTLYVRSGVLLSYGPDIVAMSRRAAVFVDKILKGAKPTALPPTQRRPREWVHRASVSATGCRGNARGRPGIGGRGLPLDGVLPPTLLARRSSTVGGSPGEARQRRHGLRVCDTR